MQLLRLGIFSICAALVISIYGMYKIVHKDINLPAIAKVIKTAIVNNEENELKSSNFNAKMQSLEEFAKFWNSSPVCQLLRQGDNATLNACINDNNFTEISPELYLNSSCAFIRNRGYLLDQSILSDDERSLPLGVSFQIYMSVWQFERLLRAVYRPHNVYCVHVDLKAKSTLYDAVRHIASCFDNVLVVEQRVAVHWGTIGSVDADLSCMRALRKASKSWRYYINLTGQEHPLRTMWQVVRALKSLGGLNSIDCGAPPHPSYNFRVLGIQNLSTAYNIVPCIGPPSVMLVREFVEQVLDRRLAQQLRSGLVGAHAPDETYFGTINHNSHLRFAGSRDFRYEPEFSNRYNVFWNRLKNWQGYLPCRGKYVRSICIWGVGDLALLTDAGRKELFVNKLHYDFQHWTLDCLESWYWEQTISELRGYWISFVTD